MAIRVCCPLATRVELAKALGVTCEAFADCEDFQAEELPAKVVWQGEGPPKEVTELLP
jgi:hypothetical protein